jgi:hypothetical protein
MKPNALKRCDFPKHVKETLAKRVGTLCSNPQCSVPTYGPHTEPTKGISKGAAAHIRAASIGGPRYDPDMTAEERKGIGNGIWLCRSCADLIDTDDVRFTGEILQRWKQVAEQRAQKALAASGSSQLGTSGVPPAGPPYAFEVPISSPPSAGS